MNLFLRISISTFCAALTSVGAVAFSATSASESEKGVSQEVLVERERRRLEELFISKMSEELKLPVEKEAPFAEAIRSLNREKAKTNLEIERALEALSSAQNLDRKKARLATDKAVKRYEKAWRAYGQLPIREVSRLRSILGLEGVGRYLLAKAQMTEKLKALSAREANETTAPATDKSRP